MPPSSRTHGIRRARHQKSNSPSSEYSRTQTSTSLSNPTERSNSSNHDSALKKRLEHIQDSIKKRTSWVWNYFEPAIVNKKIKFICQLPSERSASNMCESSITEDPHGGTKSLSRHLQQMHRMQSSAKLSQLREQEAAGMDTLTSESFKKALVNMCVEDELPFQFVNSDAFRKLLLLLNPDVKHLFITPTALKDMISGTFKLYEARLTEYFQDINHISLTCDSWTSPNHKSVLGVTAHWIDQKFELKNTTLALIEIKGPHSGQNLASHLLRVLDQFSLRSKLYCITADNASNNNTLASSLEGSITHFSRSNHLNGCIAHVINLGVRECLKHFTKSLKPNNMTVPEEFGQVVEQVISQKTACLLQKLNEISNKYKNNSQFAAHVHEIALRTPGIQKPLGLLTECLTRWNSLSHVCARAIRMKSVINFILDNDPQYSDIRITELEWGILDNIVRFLQPFERITSELSATKYPTFNLAALAYEKMMKRLCAAMDSPATMPGLRSALKPMYDKIATYRNNAIKKYTYLIAPVLDPRSKLEGICPDIVSRETLEDYVHTECIRLGITNTIESFELNEVGHSSSDSDLIDEIPASQPSRPVVHLRDEISSYLNRPVEPDSITPSTYWTLHSKQ